MRVVVVPLIGALEQDADDVSDAYDAEYLVADRDDLVAALIAGLALVSLLAVGATTAALVAGLTFIAQLPGRLVGIRRTCCGQSEEPGKQHEHCFLSHHSSPQLTCGLPQVSCFSSRESRVLPPAPAMVCAPGRARWGDSGSLNPKSAPAGPNAARGAARRDWVCARGVDRSGPAHWEHPNRVRSGRKQR